MKSSADIYESSDSQFFRTTIRIQPGPDAFDESRFVMTFLTILGVTEILCSFRLVLEGKAGKDIPESSKLEFLERFLANNFALSNAEDLRSGELRRYSRFTFVESTISNSPKVMRAKFLRSNGLLFY